MLDLEAIRKRCEAATPGPWQSDSSGEVVGLYHDRMEDFVKIVVPNTGDSLVRDEDAIFIAHSREDIPALLAEIERLNRIIAKELTENDELGAEFVYVNALKAKLEVAKTALKYMGGACIYDADENCTCIPHKTLKELDL